MPDVDGNSTDVVKSCCADLYASQWARLLLGESFHPGGLALTKRLGTLQKLEPTDCVLDVASGNGASAIFLAQQFGCEVVGIDYGAELVHAATARAVEAGLADRVRFQVGDAEGLPVDDASVDVLICECAFCTFPDKATAAAEFFRVVRPGGRLGLSDLTRTEVLPAELQTLLAWIACLGDARPVDEYVAYLHAAGFDHVQVEAHDLVLGELVRTSQGRLLGAELLAKLGTAPVPMVDLETARQLARAAAAAIAAGRLGYTLIEARRPE